jgi:arabinose-5-phosphate isomerase
VSESELLAAARTLLQIEAKAVLAQADALDENFLKVVDHIGGRDTNTLVAGVGKSGLIARMMASKLASVGTRSWYYSALDALHGELGSLRPDDLLVVLSNSGQTQELVDLAKAAVQRGVKVAAMVSRVPSALSRAADWTLKVHVEREATETKLPTASTTAMLAFADALVIAVARRRGFSVADYARNHPGGTLGVVLSATVDSLMARAPAQVALVAPDRPVLETLFEMTRHPHGAALVVDGELKLLGIVTDGDIRRALQSRGKALLDLTASAIMTGRPRTCLPGTTAVEALELMETPNQIAVLPVADAAGRVCGLLRLHDIAGREVEKILG